MTRGGDSANAGAALWLHAACLGEPQLGQLLVQAPAALPARAPARRSARLAASATRGHQSKPVPAHLAILSQTMPCRDITMLLLLLGAAAPSRSHCWLGSPVLNTLVLLADTLVLLCERAASIGSVELSS